MSGFWNLFGKQEGKPEDGQAVPEIEPPHQTQAQQQLVPTPTAPAVMPPFPEPPKPTPQLPPQRVAPRYGIDDAIMLMRTLPVEDNVDLVVRVIKKTLESMAVRVPDIIQDAAHRQDQLNSNIGEHQGAIVQLQRDIEERRQEIKKLEEELAETTKVRERLQLAEALQLQPTPTPPRTASVIPPPLRRTQSSGDINIPPASAIPRPPAPPLPATALRPIVPAVRKPAPTQPPIEAPTPKPDPALAKAPDPPTPPTPPTAANDADEDEEESVASSDLVDKPL